VLKRGRLERECWGAFCQYVGADVVWWYHSTLLCPKRKEQTNCISLTSFVLFSSPFSFTTLSRILLPPEYPFKPPHILFLTPSGRFETNKKVCLSFSAFHPELWQPAWGIRLILEALIAFLPSPADGAIGALNWSPTERQRLAKKSRDFICPHCGKVADLLPELKESSSSSPAKPSRFQKEIAQLQMMQHQEHLKQEDEKEESSDNGAVNKESEVPSSELNAVQVQNEAAPDQVETQTGDSKETKQPPMVAAAADLNQPAEETNAATPIASTPPTSGEQVSEPTDEQPTVTDHPVPGETGAVEQEEVKPSWLVEPVVHSAILLLSVICLLLIRKIQALCAELRALES
jgi:ubiquitin-conjugating enzyme E2 J1